VGGSTAEGPREEITVHEEDPLEGQVET